MTSSEPRPSSAGPWSPGQQTTHEPTPGLAGARGTTLPVRPLSVPVRAKKPVLTDPGILRRVKAALDKL